MHKKLLFLAALFGTLFSTAATGPSLQWGFNIPGSGSDAVRGVITDVAANVYITGTFTGTNTDFDFDTTTYGLSSNGGTDFYVAKYSATGQLLWVKGFGGSGADEANSICILNNNIWVTGSFRNTMDFDASANQALSSSAGNADMFVLKLDVAGNYQWHGTFGGHGADIAKSITPDFMGRILVVGQFTDTADFDPTAGYHNLISAGSNDIAFFYLSGSGGFGNAHRIGGTGDDVANSISCNSSVFNSPIVIVGKFAGTVDFNWNGGLTNSKTSNGGTDAFILCIDYLSDYQWAHTFGGVFSSDNANSVTIDAAGKILVCGNIIGTTDIDPSANIVNISSYDQSTYNGFAAKYSATGALQWAFTIPSDNQIDNQMLAISADADSNVYITGRAFTFDADPTAGQYTIQCNATREIFMLKYNSQGQIQWGTALNQIIANGTGDGVAIHADAFGNIWLGGMFYASTDINPSANTTVLMSANQTLDGFLAKYKPCDYPAAPVTVNDTICQGGAVTLNTSAMYNVGWYLAATGNDYVGPNNSQTPALAAGTYNYWVQDSTCGSGPRTQKTILVNPAPNLVLQATTSVCAGSPTELTASGADTYIWSTMETAPTINPVPAYPYTTYYAIGTNQFGCADTNSIDAYVNNPPVPDAEASNNSPCIGSVVIISDVNDIDEIYLWSTGETTDSITVTATQSMYYYVSADYGNGCIGTDSIYITVNTADVNVSQSANVLTAADASAASYQWIDCSDNLPLTGATAQVYTATVNGNYAVVITSAAGCTDTSACFNVTGLGVSSTEAHSMRLSPNPFTDFIAIDLSGFSAAGNLLQTEIVNSLGQIVSTVNVSPLSPVIPTSSLAPGAYLVKINANGAIYSYRMIKQE